jgi:hypothetical protein
MLADIFGINDQVYFLLGRIADEEMIGADKNRTDELARRIMSFPGKALTDEVA